MIQKFTIKNIATYNKTGVEFANLRKINFIYGSNGCGKQPSAISWHFRRMKISQIAN